MLLQSIRKYMKSARIPLIILVVMISVSLVGSYLVWQSPQVNTPLFDQTNPLESLRHNIRLLQQALQTDPQNEDLLIPLGNSQYDLGAYYFDIQDYDQGRTYFEAAVASYEKALEKVPENINVRVDLATAAYYSQQYDLAEEHFQKAIELEPTFINARLNYGIFLLDVREDPEGAIKQWEAALETDPEPSVASYLNNLIESVKAQGEKGE